jgi:hypothetical protein
MLAATVLQAQVRILCFELYRNKTESWRISEAFLWRVPGLSKNIFDPRVMSTVTEIEEVVDPFFGEYLD